MAIYCLFDVRSLIGDISFRIATHFTTMTRSSRYGMQVSRHRPVFQWTSDPVQSNGKAPEDTVNYSSFKLGDLAINVGDFVLVRNTDQDFQEVRSHSRNIQTQFVLTLVS